jgi:hypothetical protein
VQHSTNNNLTVSDMSRLPRRFGPGYSTAFLFPYRGQTRKCSADQRLFLIAQQFSLRVPYLQAVPVDYVMTWPQGFGGFDCQFERLKRLHGMAVVSRDVKRGVCAMTLSGFPEKFA